MVLQIFAAVLTGLLIGPPVYAAEAVDYQVVGHIAGADGKWDMAAFDPATRRVFVGRGDGVMALDVDSGTVTNQLVVGEKVHAALPIPGGNVLVTNGATNTATIIDAMDGTVKATIPTGTSPDAAAFDPVTDLVFVMNGKDNDITLIDPKALKAVGEIEVGGKLEFAVVDGKGRLYVNLEDKGEIAVIDTRARKVLSHIKLEDCEEPSGLAYVENNRVLISACANGKAMIVDIETQKVAKVLTIGPKPDAAIYDAERHLAFIPSGGNGTLAVINMGETQDPSVVQMVTTKPGARTIAEDPKTGKLYLPVAERDQPVGPDKKPTFRPGTFELLVVGSVSK